MTEQLAPTTPEERAEWVTLLDDATPGNWCHDAAYTDAPEFMRRLLADVARLEVEVVKWQEEYARQYDIVEELSGHND